MKRIFSEKFAYGLCLFLLSGMVVLSISLPVSAVTKKTAKPRKNGTSASSKTSKSSKTVKTSTSSKPKTTTVIPGERKVGVTATAKPVVKRSLATKARATSSKRSVTSASAAVRKRATARKTIGNNLSFLNQLQDKTSLEEQTCIARYTECMDAQISSIISKYSFLSEDEALNVALDTGQPFRCVYYDENSKLFKADANNLLKDDKSICINSDTNNCYTQRGVNGLYSSYNYYCDIKRSLKNSIGRKINQCDLSRGNTFANKYSTAYYNEVLNRMKGEGLQMINLETSTIYKNFLNQLNLQNMDTYVLDSSISSEIFNELNLEQEVELFSVNVVPPIGTNNYLAGSQFTTASDSCFVTKDTTSMTTAQKKIAEQHNIIASDLKAKCIPIKSNLERYYLTGKWSNIEVDANGNAVAGAVAEDVESDFFSAKESCNLYEQALISVRDSKYGEFDNQMQNWIEENLVKMIQKKIKSTSSLAQAETALKSLDQTISLNMEKTAQEIAFNKMEMEAIIAEKQNQYNLNVSNAQIQTSEVQSNLAKTYSDNYSTAVLAKCVNMISDSYDSVCGSSGEKCFSKDAILNPYYTWISNVSDRAVKVSMKGDVIPSHTNNSKTDGYDDYVVANTNASDTTKKEGYYSIYCKDVTKFNYKISFLSSLVNSVSSTYSKKVGELVEMNLKERFPEKGE